jgi:uncharacterized protein (TIGR02147 family)
MKTPNLDQFFSYREYLSKFVALNQEASKNFSYGFFSKKLGWPKSLLHDIVNGRKALGVRRALEFVEYFNFDQYQKERVLSWVFLDFKSDRVKEYVRKFIVDDLDQLKFFGEGQNNLNLTKDMHFLAYFNLVKELKRFPTTAEIQKHSLFCYISHSDAEQFKTILLKEKFVEFVDPQKMSDVRVLRHSLFVDHKDDAYDVHSSFSQLVAEYVKSPKPGHKSLNSMFCRVDKSKVDEIVKRVVQLRNWINEFDKDSQGPNEVYSCMLHFFPVTDICDIQRGDESSDGFCP